MKKLVFLIAVCFAMFSCNPNNSPTSEECTNYITVLKFDNPQQQKYVLARCTDKWVFPVGLWLSEKDSFIDSLFTNPYLDLEEGYVMVNWAWEDPFCLLHPTVDCFADEQLIPVETTQYCYLPDYEWADGIQMPQLYMSRDTTNVVVIEPFVGFYSPKVLENRVNGKLVEEDSNSHQYSLRYGCAPISGEYTEDRLEYITIQAEWKDMLNKLIREDRLADLPFYYF